MYGVEVEMHNCKEVSRRLESMHEPRLPCFMVKYGILYKLDIYMVR